MVHLHPTAFDHCLLKCVQRGDIIQNSIYKLDTCSTTFTQLGFKAPIYRGIGSLFVCDIMPARDGGQPFLIVVSAVRIGGQDIQEQDPMTLYLLLKGIIEDPDWFDGSLATNQYRVRAPLVFPVQKLVDYDTLWEPNASFLAKGLWVLGDSVDIDITTTKSQDEEFGNEGPKKMILRKTPKPDIYTVCDASLNEIAENNVAFVPTLEASKKLKKMFETANTVALMCEFDETRRRWVPILSEERGNANGGNHTGPDLNNQKPLEKRGIVVGNIHYQ